MDTNVYVIDSDYIISRYVIGTNKEYIEQIVIDDNSNEDVEIETENVGTSSTIIEHNLGTIPRNTVLMPCYGDEQMFMNNVRPNSGNLTNFNLEDSNVCNNVIEILYNSNKTEEPKSTRTSISRKKPQKDVENVTYTKIEKQVKSAPLANFINDCYMLYPSTPVNSGTNYANERYMIYSGTKSRLRNRLTTDSVKMITNKQFKRQLMDTSDTLSPLTLLPHTRKLMNISSWKFSKSLIMPQTKQSIFTQELFTRNCISNHELDEMDTNELGLMPIGYTPHIDRSKIKRITRRKKNVCLQKYPNNENLKDNETSISTSNQAINNVSINREVEVMHNELQDLLNQPENNSCYLYDGNKRVGEQIIVVHDGHETAESTAYTQQNIEVLLAAAAEDELSTPLVICQSSSDIASVGGDHDSLMADGQQIIFVQDGINTVLPVYSKS